MAPDESVSHQSFFADTQTVNTNKHWVCGAVGAGEGHPALLSGDCAWLPCTISAVRHSPSLCPPSPSQRFLTAEGKHHVVLSLDSPLSFFAYPPCPFLSPFSLGVGLKLLLTSPTVGGEWINDTCCAMHHVRMLLSSVQGAGATAAPHGSSLFGAQKVQRCGRLAQRQFSVPAARAAQHCGGLELQSGLQCGGSSTLIFDCWCDSQPTSPAGAQQRTHFTGSMHRAPRKHTWAPACAEAEEVAEAEPPPNAWEAAWAVAWARACTITGCAVMSDEARAAEGRDGEIGKQFRILAETNAVDRMQIPNPAKAHTGALSLHLCQNIARCEPSRLGHGLCVCLQQQQQQGDVARFIATSSNQERLRQCGCRAGWAFQRAAPSLPYRHAHLGNLGSSQHANGDGSASRGGSLGHGRGKAAWAGLGFGGGRGKGLHVTRRARNMCE